MVIDFRYHVASIVAIFIALALGILIGSTLVGQDFLANLAEEQKIWISK
ncbi:MAG: copper transporter, partial [Peptococcales bacterium]